jgi:hypothetical protein
MLIKVAIIETDASFCVFVVILVSLDRKMTNY